MKERSEEIKELLKTDLSAVTTLKEVNDLKVKFLGKKGLVTELTSNMKDIPVEERKPIIIYINTPGGVITDGYCLIDAIRSSVTPVYTVNIGTCYSMGFLIFIAGKKRYCMQSSTFLCHDGFSGAVDSMNKLRDRVEFETGEMEEYTMNYIIEQTKITKKQYTANKRKEWYFYPNEAKELGVTDYIVGVDCDIYEIL